MRKIALIIMATMISAVFFTGIAVSSDTATVGCTATFTQLGVSVNPTTYDFGFGQANDWSNTTGDHFTVTNEGNNNEDIKIQAAKDAGNTWDLGSSNGADTVVMKALGGDLGSWTDIHTQQTLKSDLASSSTTNFDLAFQFPSSTSTYDQQSFTVTLTAVSS